MPLEIVFLFYYNTTELFVDSEKYIYSDWVELQITSTITITKWMNHERNIWGNLIQILFNQIISM